MSFLAQFCLVCNNNNNKKTYVQRIQHGEVNDERAKLVFCAKFWEKINCLM